MNNQFRDRYCLWYLATRPVALVGSHRFAIIVRGFRLELPIHGGKLKNGEYRGDVGEVWLVGTRLQQQHRPIIFLRQSVGQHRAGRATPDYHEIVTTLRGQGWPHPRFVIDDIRPVHTDQDTKKHQETQFWAVRHCYSHGRYFPNVGHFFFFFEGKIVLFHPRIIIRLLLPYFVSIFVRLYFRVKKEYFRGFGIF